MPAEGTFARQASCHMADAASVGRNPESLTVVTRSVEGAIPLRRNPQPVSGIVWMASPGAAHRVNGHAGFEARLEHPCCERARAMPSEALSPTIEPMQAGWLVEVSMPRLHAREPAQILFAAAIDDAHAAVSVVRRTVGALHCAIEARCRLSPRALSQIGVTPGGVKSF